MSNNFDLKKFLVENKLTTNSIMAEESEKPRTNLKVLKDKNGAFLKDGTQAFHHNEDIAGPVNYNQTLKYAQGMANYIFGKETDNYQKQQFIQDWMDSWEEGGYSSDSERMRENKLTTNSKINEVDSRVTLFEKVVDLLQQAQDLLDQDSDGVEDGFEDNGEYTFADIKHIISFGKQLIDDFKSGTINELGDLEFATVQDYVENIYGKHVLDLIYDDLTPNEWDNFVSIDSKMELDDFVSNYVN